MQASSPKVLLTYFIHNGCDFRRKVPWLKSVRRYSCWLASNITAGTVEQISLLVQQPGVVKQLINNALINNASREVHKLALMALSNICKFGSDADVQALNKCQGLQPLADAARRMDADESVLVACSDAIMRVVLMP